MSVYKKFTFKIAYPYEFFKRQFLMYLNMISFIINFLKSKGEL